MAKHKKKYNLKMVRELAALWGKESRTVIKYLESENILVSHPESAKIIKKYQS